MYLLGMENFFTKKGAEYRLEGNITTKTKDKLFKFLEREKLDKLILDTSGGDIRASIEIVTEIKKRGLNPEIVIDNKAYSSGSFIFLSFKKRFVTKNSTLYIHDIKLNSASPSKELREERKCYRRILLRLVARNFNITDIEADKMIKKGRMLSDNEIMKKLNARMLK